MHEACLERHDSLAHGRQRRYSKEGRNSDVAVKLRLMRMGKKKQPTYRLVAADSRSPRDGRFIEALGMYAPRGRSKADQEAVVEIDLAKTDKWLSQGAQPTERVAKLLELARAAAPSAEQAASEGADAEPAHAEAAGTAPAGGEPAGTAPAGGEPAGGEQEVQG